MCTAVTMLTYISLYSANPGSEAPVKSPTGIPWLWPTYVMSTILTSSWGLMLNTTLSYHSEAEGPQCHIWMPLHACSRGCGPFGDRMGHQASRQTKR